MRCSGRKSPVGFFHALPQKETCQLLALTPCFPCDLWLIIEDGVFQR